MKGRVENVVDIKGPARERKPNDPGSEGRQVQGNASEVGGVQLRTGVWLVRNCTITGNG